MLDTQAVQVLMVVASICVVILTLAALATMLFLVRAVVEVRALFKIVHAEAHELVAAKRALTSRVRYARRWTAFFVRHLGNARGN